MYKNDATPSAVMNDSVMKTLSSAGTGTVIKTMNVSVMKTLSSAGTWDVTSELEAVREELANITIPDFPESKRTERKRGEAIHKYEVWKHDMPSAETIEKLKSVDQD